MSRLSDLIKETKAKDPQLGADLEAEFRNLNQRRSFGLNFERHVPEAVELPGRPIRSGDKVRVLPPRGTTKRGDKRLWRVARIETTDGSRVAQLVPVKGDQADARSCAIEDLVVVAEFQDPIYPGLRSTGRVERGGDKPFHTVINGENYHALRTLIYTHRGRVDAIYIDPPYNTGAKDWKYNNDYVEGDDIYRHSKWLAFMERRLLLANELLNPDDSVLIITIDEKEYLRLGLLLEQTFPSARITMVTATINPGGSPRQDTFFRSAEYIFFVQLGSSRPGPLPLPEEWNPVKRLSKHDIRWREALRSGTNALRSERPNAFYPIHIRDTEAGPIFAGVGDAYYGEDWQAIPAPEGCVAVWPIRRDGSEGRWQNSADEMRKLIAAGHARLGLWREDKTSVTYLNSGERKKIIDGLFPVTGVRTDGSVVTDGSEYQAKFVPNDVWRIASHDARTHGSQLLGKVLPDRKFPFAKSLYAVEDALRFFTATKPDALVLDFFAGSGTTTHAVMRLNHLDGGRRQSICVTNNEVSIDEQAGLRTKGLRPGDSDWEALGICDYITKPRIHAAIVGRSTLDEPIEGSYRFVDEFPMSNGFPENVEFFTLTYESPRRVSHNRAFGAIAPLLWLRAGATGPLIDSVEGYAVAETYGILEDLDRTHDFLDELKGSETIRMAFIVTNDDRRYQMVCADLPSRVEPVRLYESYLTNFEIVGRQ